MQKISGVSATPSVPYAKYYPADELDDQNLYLCIPQLSNGKLNWNSFLYTFANNLAKSGSSVVLTRETTGYAGNMATLAQTIRDACKRWNLIRRNGPMFYAHKRGENVRIVKVYPRVW